MNDYKLKTRLKTNKFKFEQKKKKVNIRINYILVRFSLEKLHFQFSILNHSNLAP